MDTFKISKDRSGGYFIYQLSDLPNRCPLEEVEQQNFTAQMRYYFPDVVWFHVPNEGKHKIQYRQKQERMGALKGASDIIILSRGAIHPCAVIELKRIIPSMSTTSKEQKKFLTDNVEQGNYAALCYGYEAALRAVQDYMGCNNGR